MDIQAIKEFAKAIRRTAVQMAYNTRTSHTGGTVSQADVLAVLYSGVMEISPETIDSPSRDRFNPEQRALLCFILCSIGSERIYEL